jgi:ribosome biogenesis protein BMS1
MALFLFSGKSTLIRSLVKNWTKQNLKEANGPVTVVTGKGRRVTLIE